MKESLETLRDEVLDRLSHCASEPEIDLLRVEYLGRKGKLTLIFRGLREIPPEERPQVGDQLNRLRRFVEEHIEIRLEELKRQEKERILSEERWISPFLEAAGSVAGYIRSPL